MRQLLTLASRQLPDIQQAVRQAANDPSQALRSTALGDNLPVMEGDFPSSWACLRYPWVRAELIAYLEELAVSDPRVVWRAEANQGLITGMDQVISFFFDHHDFDDAEIGLSLFNEAEMALVQSVRSALDQLIKKLPGGSDDDYVADPLWRAVAESAAAANKVISSP